jgi:hypothetical protein
MKTTFYRRPHKTNCPLPLSVCPQNHLQADRIAFPPPHLVACPRGENSLGPQGARYSSRRRNRQVPPDDSRSAAASPSPRIYKSAYHPAVAHQHLLGVARCNHLNMWHFLFHILISCIRNEMMFLNMQSGGGSDAQA